MKEGENAQNCKEFLAKEKKQGIPKKQGKEDQENGCCSGTAIFPKAPVTKIRVSAPAPYRKPLLSTGCFGNWAAFWAPCRSKMERFDWRSSCISNGCELHLGDRLRGSWGSDSRASEPCDPDCLVNRRAETLKNPNLAVFPKRQ